MENNKILENGVSILINVLFIVIFLTIFFFTFISRLEKEIVETQLKYLVDNSFNFIQFFPQDIKNTLKTALDTFDLSGNAELDNMVIANNKKILKQAIIFVIFFSIVISLIIGIIFFAQKDNKDFSFIKLGGTNIILLFGVIFIEFMFARFITTEYLSIRPDKIKLELLKKIKIAL